MGNKYLLILVASVTFFSCKKYRVDMPAPPAPEPAVLLKDIEVSRLPSPYYHFEYDQSGRVSSVSFASGLTNYNVFYSGDRINEMRNTTFVNKDRLQYEYDDEGRIDAVNYTDSNGVVYKRVVMTYSGQKLLELARLQKSGNGFITEKLVTFQYYADGNLSTLTTEYPQTSSQPESISSVKFEQYDNKINVDGFGLIHDEFFDHLVLLPGVQLQKNNPGKESRSGDGENYSVDYTYTYSEKNLPLVKSGNAIILNGLNAGFRFQISSVYTYY